VAGQSFETIPANRNGSHKLSTCLRIRTIPLKPSPRTATVLTTPSS